MKLFIIFQVCRAVVLYLLFKWAPILILEWSHHSLSYGLVAFGSLHVIFRSMYNAKNIWRFWTQNNFFRVYGFKTLCLNYVPFSFFSFFLFSQKTLQKVFLFFNLNINHYNFEWYLAISSPSCMTWNLIKSLISPGTMAWMWGAQHWLLLNRTCRNLITNQFVHWTKFFSKLSFFKMHIKIIVLFFKNA